jgi:hypothetical protein
MMHDRERSDSAIVAMKPANKAGASKAAAAELVKDWPAHPICDHPTFAMPVPCATHTQS